MSYLNEFHKRIEAKDFMGLLQLWEEYCTCDEVDGLELDKILSLVRESDYSDSFGNYAESILPLWKSIVDPQIADSVFEKILDIQTKNSPVLAELAYEFLKSRYSKEKQFNEKIRLVGLRNKVHFSSAIRNYKLLSHMEEGSFVFHKAGWGTGEILAISPIREEVTVEFENVSGKKQISFENAFKTLEPLAKEHFLAMRFGAADLLEEWARQDPLKIVRKLLNDLGPKSAIEIKEELCELVIPKEDWTSWWQQTRSRLKKDSTIQTPPNQSSPFLVREKELSPADRFLQESEKTKKPDDLIYLTYSFVRDFSECLRQPNIMEGLECLIEKLLHQNLHEGQLFELYCLGLETPKKELFDQKIAALIEKTENPHTLLVQVPIVSFQKKLLIHLREKKGRWSTLFAQLLTEVEPSLLKEYLFKELLLQARPVLDKQLEKCLEKPEEHAEFIAWYAPKIFNEPSLPLGDPLRFWSLFEAYLIALHATESRISLLPLTKKMHLFLTAKRFATIRKWMEGGTIERLQEVLLLASKCQSFSQEENKILASLATVACPALKSVLGSDESQLYERVIWATEGGMRKIQLRIEELMSREMLDNAREIETARSHGDLRENSEYKFALERRSRIQGEIRALSRQLSHAKLISKTESQGSRVNVGMHIDLQKENGERMRYTILGPWEANPENNVISFQSKLALSLMGKIPGDSLTIQGVECSILAIGCALEQSPS